MNTMRWMGIASRSTALRSAAWSRSSRTAAKAWAAWALHGGHGASPDLPLLLLELVDHLLHEQRVDPGGDGPKLRLLPVNTSRADNFGVRNCRCDLGRWRIPPEPLQRSGCRRS